MSGLYVIVLTQGDQRFHEKIEPLLMSYDTVNVSYLDECSYSIDGFDGLDADMILINADRFRLTKKCKESFRALAEKAGKSGKSVSVLMLTNNMSVERFLRDQNYFVTDTVDISGDLCVLKKILDESLLTTPAL